MEPDQLRDGLGDVQVVDVHEDDEWNEGHRAGRELIDADGDRGRVA